MPDPAGDVFSDRVTNVRPGLAPSMHALPPPGTLDLLPGSPNPNGAPGAALYLLAGDATTRRISRIVPAEGARFPPGRLPLTRPVRIKLLHFNDLHGRIAAAPWPVTDQESFPVFSRVVAWLHATRARYADDPQAAVLALSGGDESGGQIFDVLLGQDPQTYQVHAGYRLCSAAGIDAGVLGNHEFDRGTALLAHAIRQDARFPMLAANVTGCPELQECCYPAALFVVGGVRVGLIGLITPAQMHPEPYSSRRVTDPVEVAHNLLPAVRSLCDVLIILSHLGHSLSQTSATVKIAGDVELARSLTAGDVHLIIGSHTHTLLNENGLSAGNIVNGIPIVQAGKFGEFVGEVDVTVHRVATVTHARLHATVELPVDETFEREQVQPLLERVRPYRARIIGRVADDRDLSTDAVRNGFASGESSLTNFVADALVTESRARGYPIDLAMVDASSVNCGLEGGRNVSYADWFDVMPFSDVLCCVRVTGRQLRELLNDNARRMDRPGDPHTERGFLHFSKEIRYAVDPGKVRSEAQAKEITMRGEPIEGFFECTFLVACSSFLRGPAVPWEATVREQLGPPVIDLQQLPKEYTDLCVRDLLVDHITAHGGVLPEGGAKRDGRLRLLA